MSSWVELRRRSVYSDTTQLNSTDLLRADYAATGSVALPIAGDSWVASVRVSIATQLNWTQLDVQLGWVELCRYKRAFSSTRYDCPPVNSHEQSRQWVDGSWVSGSNESLFGMGHMCHGSVHVDPWPNIQLTQQITVQHTCARRLLVIPTSSAECERHFSALNARHIITSQRPIIIMLFAALSIVLEKYENKLLHWTAEIPVFFCFPFCMNLQRTVY